MVITLKIYQIKHGLKVQNNNSTKLILISIGIKTFKLKDGNLPPLKESSNEGKIQ